MSTLANDYYKYARLATAAYVDLTDVVDLRNRDQLSGAANGQRRMPTALGDQFFDVTNGWSILGDPRFPLAGGGEQHNDPASGFAATLFKDNVTGEKVLAIRGTEITTDATNDFFDADLAQIGGLGIAIRQLVSLFNLVQRFRAPSSQTDVRQLTLRTGTTPPPPDVQFVANTVAQPDGSPTTTYYWLESHDDGVGQNVIGPTDTLTVVGHSLGGHLAAMAERLFPNLFTKAVVFNAPGYDSPISAKLTGAFLDLFVPFGATPASGFSNITSLVSEDTAPGNDIAIVPSGITGTRYGADTTVTTELNSHVIEPFMDSLAVQSLMSSMNDNLSVADLGRILQSASATAFESDETLLSSLYFLLKGTKPAPALTPFSATLVTAGDIAARQSYYTALLDLQNFVKTNPTLLLASLVDASTDSLKNLATSGDVDAMAYRYALKELNPFAIFGPGSLYQPHNQNRELELYAPSANSLTGMSSEYIADRAAFLRAKNVANVNDVTSIQNLQTADSWRYVDLPQNYIVTVAGVGGAAEATIRWAMFGGDGTDEIKGKDRDDHLYGGGGNDVLLGGAGNDYLEDLSGDDFLGGEDGDDTLNALDGAGGDRLRGGRGFDTYYVDFGDSIEDTPGQNAGVIFVGRNKIRLTGGRRIQGDEEFTDGNFIYITDGQGAIWVRERNGTQWLKIEAPSSPVPGLVDDGNTVTTGRPDLGIALVTEKNPKPLPRERDPVVLQLYNRAITWRPVYDPLALDLAGDGFQTVGDLGDGTVLFDHGGNGVRNGTGWLAGGRDAWVVLDRDGDGVITTGNELFGVDTLLPGGTKARDGFEAIAPLDTNHDGRVDANDSPLAAWQVRADLNGDGIIGGDEFRAAGFGDLKLWRDTNQNGFSEPFELQSLAEAGIASVNLDSVADGRLLGAGNSLARRGSFTRTDGSTGTSGAVDLVNVSFYRDFATQPVFDPALASLPTSLGSGRVRNLLQAASASPELRASLQNEAAAPTRAAQRAGIDGLLHTWAADSTMSTGTRAAFARPDRSVLVYSFNDVPLTMSVGNAYLQAADAYRAAHPGTTGPIAVEDLPAGWFEARQSQAYRDRVELIETLERFIGQTFVNVAGAQSSVAYSEFVPANGTTPAHTFTVNAISSSIGIDNWGFLKDAYEVLKDTVYGSVVSQTRLDPYVQAAVAGVATHDFSTVEAMLSAKRANNPGEALADIVELGTYLGTQLVDRRWLNLPGMIGTWSREALADPALAGVVADLRIKSRNDIFLTGSMQGDVLLGTDWRPDFFTTAPNTVDGREGNDIILGGTVGEELKGGTGDDIIDVGTGGKHVLSGPGRDTILFGRGAGSVTADAAGEATDADRDLLQFLPGIAPGDVRVRRTSIPADSDSRLHMAFNILGTSDSFLDMVFFFGNSINIGRTIQEVRFADGTVWDLATILLKGIEGTDGNDTLLGYDNSDDTIDGKGGNDFIDGGFFGNDSLIGGDGDDQLVGGPGASSGDDTLDGGTGNDTLTGGLGSDTYIFGFGYGQDRMVEGSSTTDIDTLKILANPGDVTLAREFNNLVFGLKGTSDRMTVDWFTDSSARIERVAFADGTTWDISGANVVAGSDGVSNNLTGGTGGDLLIGGNLNDVLAGGAGNDTLSGGAGDDTYLFDIGNGVDHIQDVAALGEGNTLQFGAGITQDMLKLGLGSLLIRVGTGGDAVHLDTFDPSNVAGAHAVETFRFNDGSSLSYASLIARGFDLSGTDGNDIITGTNVTDRIDGKGGNDTLMGGAGSDTYTFGSGSGQDLIREASASGDVDTLQVLANPGDVTVTREASNLVVSLNGTSDRVAIDWFTDPSARIERVVFADGTIWSAATLEAQAGGPVNHSPVVATSIADQSATEDSAFSFTVPANTFTDADAGDTLSYSSTLSNGGALPAWLSFDPVTRTFSGTPANGDVGTVSVKVVVTDSQGAAVFDVFDLSVANTNDAPVAVADSVSVNENGTTANLVPVLLANDTDVDAGDTRSITAVNTTGTIGSVAFNSATQSLTYSANAASQDGLRAGQTASDSFTYTIADAAGATSTATVNVTVTGVNDTPVAVANSVAVNENATTANLVTTLLANDTDVDTGDTRSITAVNTTGTIGAVAFNAATQSLTYSANAAAQDALRAGQTASDSFTYTIADAAGATSTATVNVTVTGVNDAPVLANQTAAQNATANQAFSFVLPANTFTDVDSGDTLTYSATLASGAALPSWLTFNATTRTFAGTPGQADVGTASVKVIATDTQGAIASDAFDISVAAALGGIVGTAGNDTLVGTAGADTISGLAGNDSLSGGAGNDTLDGGSGQDTMVGGLGDDVYVVDDFSDVVTENANEGADTVQSSLTYTLGANLENLTLTGISAINGNGNTLANVITGNAANNTLDGGTGADTLIGGLGNDVYLVDNVSDVVTENANEGTDTVFSSVTLALSASVENLTLTGTSAINGTGNALDNVLTGNSAVNTLTGGLGNDTYVAGTGDILVENANEGTDTVQSGVTWTLAANIENLTLTGGIAINGTGNTLNNVLTGNTGDNTLNGGTGADTMVGGLGNDTYVVDNVSDVVTENTNEGTDTVQSSLTYALGANLENLTLTGTSAINGTGNALDNVLTGNSAVNTLTGGLGNDTYVVGTGDIVVENANEGIDTVQSALTYTLGANLENLTLTGFNNVNGTGNALDNVLAGNIGTNTLTGGAGNDTYFVNAGDTVVEAAGGGTDTVISSDIWTLGANIENLTFAENEPGDTSAGTGNALNNILTGNSQGQTLDGGAGADTMIGGGGSDWYIVDNAGDVVIEDPDWGFDKVITALSYTLTANVEYLELTGTAAVNGTGNALDNSLRGNAAVNTLTGGLGNDTYGVDNLGDVVIENAGEGIDSVESTVSWTLGANVENLSLMGSAAIDGTGNALDNRISGNSMNNVLRGGLGNDTYSVSSGDTVIENAGEGIDTVESTTSYTLGANLENLNITGSGTGTGNELDNVLALTAFGVFAPSSLVGLGGNDVLVGSSGSAAVTLFGGTGNDTYRTATSASVNENVGEGWDTVIASANAALTANVESLVLTGGAVTGDGNADANLLHGNTLNNVLRGQGGVDVLEGDAGDDTLYSDGVNPDTQNAYLNGGVGNDVLNGGSGRELYIGGAGNDTINTGNGADVIAFNAGDGQDSVNPSVGTDDTLSLGGAGLSYANLTFQKNANDLILNVSATDKITFTNWYAASANKNVLNLQVVAEAMAGFNPSGGNPLLDNKVESFNFQGLVNAFDSARAANPGLSSWALTNGLTQFQLAGSDTAALGGDLAYQYGLNGTLAGIGFNKAQDVLTSAQFGTQAQTLRPLATLQDGFVPLS